MRVLIIGSGGGREHALAWKLANEGHEIFGTGRSGIAQVARVIPGSDYLAIAAAVEPDLTVVGPEAVLVTGVVDQFRAANRPIVGPNQANAQIEEQNPFEATPWRSSGFRRPASRG